MPEVKKINQIKVWDTNYYLDAIYANYAISAGTADTASYASAAESAVKLNGRTDEYYLNYDNLTNKPTKLGDFFNDKNYLTGFTETDPTVPSHVKSITTTDIANWNGKSAFNGDYNNLTNKPTIPTNNNQLTNGAGYITSSDVANKADKTYVDQKIADLVNSAPEALDTLGELATALETHKNSYDALLEVVGGKINVDNVKQGNGISVAKSGSDATINAALKNYNKMSMDAVATSSELYDKFYPTVLDKSGNLATFVPWEENTTYSLSVSSGNVSLKDNNNTEVGNFTITNLLTAGEGLKIENGVISITYPNGDEESY